MLMWLFELVESTAVEESAVSWILWRSAGVESLVDTVAAMVHDSSRYEAFRRRGDLRFLDTAGLDGLAAFLPRAQPPKDRAADRHDRLSLGDEHDAVLDPGQLPHESCSTRQ